MKRSKANIFLNNRWFTAFTIIMFIAGMVELVLCFTTKSVDYIMVPFVAVLGVIMYGSYRAHDKNVMKGLMGAELMWMLSSEVAITCTLMVTGKDAFKAGLGSGYSFFVVIEMIALLTMLFIFALHFMINSQRESSPTEIWLNQLLNVFLIVIYLVITILLLAFDYLSASMIVLMIFKVALMLMVISIESRLDEYRIRRERRGWVNPDNLR